MERIGIKMKNNILKICMVGLLLIIILVSGACGSEEKIMAPIPMPLVEDPVKTKKHEISMHGYEETAYIIREAEKEALQQEEARCSPLKEIETIWDK